MNEQAAVTNDGDKPLVELLIRDEDAPPPQGVKIASPLKATILYLFGYLCACTTILFATIILRKLDGSDDPTSTPSATYDALNGLVRAQGLGAIAVFLIAVFLMFGWAMRPKKIKLVTLPTKLQEQLKTST